MEIDFVRLWRWLARFKIIPAGFSVAMEGGGRYSPAFEREHHVLEPHGPVSQTAFLLYGQELRLHG